MEFATWLDECGVRIIENHEVFDVLWDRIRTHKPGVVVAHSDTPNAEHQARVLPSPECSCSTVFEGLVLLREIHDHYEEDMARWKPHSDGPGHWHSKPGQWDADGSPCEWCDTWNRLREFIKQNDRLHGREGSEV